MLKNYIRADKYRQQLAQTLRKPEASATAALCKCIMSDYVYFMQLVGEFISFHIHVNPTFLIRSLHDAIFSNMLESPPSPNPHK